jgi:serine/threonine-protein kinase
MTSAVRSCPACHTPLPEEAQFCMRCGAATPTDPGAPPRTAATDTAEVTQVRTALAGVYQVERVLGEGGMATVYLAEDVKHRRKVAVKVMRPELAATLGANRFLREIEIAAQLSHPHILPVHDSGASQGLLYYVMPYVDGESLRERLHREGQLPPDEAVRLAREVAEAIAYAHGRGIIHRDIKPANIMLGAGHALVADFGIARAVRNEAGLTGTGLAVGTPQYMSPEQASGARDVDARADIYALGGVLYEMLTGEPPFTGDTPQAILARSLTEEVKPLEAVRPGLPAALGATIRRAMKKDPADRYQSAGELVAALGAALDAVRTGGTAAVAAGPTAGRVGAIFGVAVAAALAVVYAVMKQVGLPPWAFALAVVLLGLGWPVLQLTRKVEARRLAGREVRGLRRLLTWQTAIAGGVAALAVWAAVATTIVMRGTNRGGVAGARRLAVLPFENRGAAADAYFVEGIADQVRGKLTGIGGFQVTARSSSDQYRQTTKSPKDIGRELGVDYLLTATVTWARTAAGAGRVQVVPELIDTRTGAAAWQQSFDADLTDVFQVQEAIATQVATALGVALGTGEQASLAARPTQNLPAYDAFLRGEAIFRELAGADPPSLRRAASYYEQAVALDSAFAQAWSQLGRVRSNLFYLSVPTPAEAEGARRAVERAQALAPRAPETYLAQSFYSQYVLRDPARAREAAAQGLAAAPSNVDLMVRVAGFQVGEQPEEAVRTQRRAAELDPRSVQTWVALGNTLLTLRRYAEAADAIGRGRTIDPASFRLLQLELMNHLAQGDLAGGRRVLAGVSRDVDQAALVAYLATYNDLYWVLSDAQQTLLLNLPPSAFDNDRATWGTVMMQTYYVRGDRARASAYADSARPAYEAQLRDAPDDPQLHALYGLALAYLGRRDDAIREGRRGVDLAQSSSFNRAYDQHQLARIYTLVGEPNQAIDQLELLLQLPYNLSPAWLKIDPTFAPLRGNPRFERLAAGRPAG